MLLAMSLLENITAVRMQHLRFQCIFLAAMSQKQETHVQLSWHMSQGLHTLQTSWRTLQQGLSALAMCMLLACGLSQ